MNKALILLQAFVICLTSSLSWAEVHPRERLGTLQITDITLRPRFVVEEPSTVDFQIGESSAGLSWSLDQQFTTKFRIGPRSLINQPARYSLAPTDELSLVEAYGEWNGAFGRMRMGLIPLEFGAEGEYSEAEMRFPRSQLFAKRVIGLRDMGISYFIEHLGYFTSFAVHNGEGGDANSDGRVWLTSKWGWTDSRKFKAGLSGQTGTTKPDSTSTSGDSLADVDESKAALWRTGGLFADWKTSGWHLQLDAYLGEREQDKQAVKYSAGHFDVAYDFSSAFGMQVRYDSFDPNHKVDGDLVCEATLGFRFSHKSQTSNFYFLGTKVFEESGQFANDRFSLIWVLTP